MTAIASLDAPPTPQGGIITDGNYQLAQAEAFTAESWNASLRIAKVVSQGTITSTVDEVGAASVSMSSGSYTISGDTLTWNIDCPAAATDTCSYTATASSLTLFETGNPATVTLVMTYDRVQ